MLKRLFDIVVALISLVLFSPLFLICYLLVKWDDSEGDVIYSQMRVGKGGKEFKIYKFRSMVPNAEAFNEQLLADQQNDKRITGAGKFLREHHLDELPQLWNVLKGDMSFVGYRPERQFFIDQIREHDSRYDCLFQIQPGVTSYATLYNGYTDTMDKMLRRLHYDLYYLEHRNLLFDMKVLWRTFWSIARGKKF